MEIVKPKKYVKEKMSTSVEIPKPKEREMQHPFEWIMPKQAPVDRPRPADSRDENKRRG